MMMNQPPTISLIVPVHNGGEKFKQCLASLLKVDPAPLEIIVVIDVASDDSRDAAESAGAVVLTTTERFGPAHARNLGAYAALGDLIFFVDSDVTIEPNAIKQVIAIFQQEPDLAAVIGSYDDAPAENNFLSQYRNLLHHYIHQTSNAEASTFWGACGVIRRDVFLQINGFNEHYRQACIEDIELGYRLKRAGHRIRLVKTLTVKHLKRWEIANMLKTDFFRRALPWTELILQQQQFINDLNLKTSNRISVVLVYGILATLSVSWWRPVWLYVSAILALLLVSLNMPVYCFFRRKRGYLFALRTIPWHWLYYLSGGLAFILKTVQFKFSKLLLKKSGSIQLQ